MIKIPVKKWGNSHAIRLPKNILDALEAEQDDELNVEVIEHSVVITKAKTEITFEELFKGYDGEKFRTEIQEITPVGNEKW